MAAPELVIEPAGLLCTLGRDEKGFHPCNFLKDHAPPCQQNTPAALPDPNATHTFVGDPLATVCTLCDLPRDHERHWDMPF